MTTITDNAAAFLAAPRERPLQVKPGPDQNDVRFGEVVVKVAAAAVSPIDWKMQDEAIVPIDYPAILGCDVAGIIVKVSSGTTRFKPGDRVFGYTLGFQLNDPRYGGYQHYVTCRETFVVKIPQDLSFVDAAIIPSSLGTAIHGLFNVLGLDPPRIDAHSQPSKGVVLIWGGSGSVGSNAIQLAALAGYDIVTTASVKNHDLVKSLIAKTQCNERTIRVFDHSDPRVNELIISYIRSTAQKLVGVFDCIGDAETTTKSCINIYQSFSGGHIASVLPPPKQLPEGIAVTMVNGSAPEMVEEPGSQIFRDYVPQALECGIFHAAPEALVLEGGLDMVQAALDLVKKGMSAKKVVLQMLDP